MIEINPAKLEEEIDAFKRGVYYKNSNIFNEKTTIKALKEHASNENVGLKDIHPAVRLAYLDAKRTMSGIKETDRDNALRDIETALWKFFIEKPVQKSAPDFDKEHDKLCKIWCESIKNKEIGTYGKAQKIVNMSFKYLFCCKDADDYKEYFKFCHMPLDSFTLEWFKREYSSDASNIEWYENEEKSKLKPRIIIEKIASWSALEYDAENDPQKALGFYPREGKKKFYSYLFYLENIRRYIDKKEINHTEEPKESLSPLELEFLVWPEIQRHRAAEGFLIGLEENPSDKRKKEIRKNPLVDKYTDIVNFLFENGYKDDIIRILTEKGYKISISDKTEKP